MTQEFVTLPREVVELAIEALFCTDSEEGSTAYENELEAVKKLRAALDQPQIQSGVIPPNWKLVPVEPTQEMFAAACRDGADLNGRPVWKHTVDVQAAWRWGQMLAAAPQPPVVEQPRQVEMLGETCIDGGKCHHKCTDRCFRRECCAPFSDYSGPWKYEQTQPQAKQEPVAVIGDVWTLNWVGGDPIATIVKKHGLKIGDKLYTYQQPKREPLTVEQIDAIADAMPGGLEGFMKGCGWRQFARAVIEATHNIK